MGIFYSSYENVCNIRSSWGCQVGLDSHPCGDRFGAGRPRSTDRWGTVRYMLIERQGPDSY